MPEAEAESPSLYAAREPVFPKAVAGFYRRLKWWIMGITLAIYYASTQERLFYRGHLVELPRTLGIEFTDRLRYDRGRFFGEKFSGNFSG